MITSTDDYSRIDALHFERIVPKSEESLYTAKEIKSIPEDSVIRFVKGKFCYCWLTGVGATPNYYTSEVADYHFNQSSEKLYYNEEDEKVYKWNASGTAIEDVTYIVWTIRTDTRWNGSKAFVKHITEAIVAYVMACWLKGRLDDRVAFYESLHANTLAMAIKNIFTKQAPTK